MPKRWLLILAAAAAPGVCIRLQAAEPPGSEPSEVVVTATRLGAPVFDVPASISSVSGEQLTQQALGVNLSDDIQSVPGLLARNRNNYAQDQQISIRGIGANSTFGVRGVRIYQDGIPSTGADGQGQVSQFNLESAERVEVLRGPFSALYGNSSGGVIQIFTADGTAPGEVRTGLAYGSYDTFRAFADASDALGPFAYHVDYTHFLFEGYRDHQSARNESFNGKFDFTIDDRSRLALLANVISRPDAEDPLGLTPAAFAMDPDQTDPAAERYNTRKSLEQQQAGLTYDLQLTDTQALHVMGYYGHRSVLQFLAIPIAAQAAPTSSGGVVDLDRGFGGADLRWSWQGPLAGSPLSWVAGVSYDRQNELRRGYDNFIGSQLGVIGALRRNENDVTYDLDEYTQGTWQFDSRWSLTLGVRHSDVHFDVQDHYIVAGNGNDSGGVDYAATSPVAGLLFAATPWMHLYASYGQGFQTPVGSELAYRPEGGSGLNLALRPARSDNTELGAKFDSGAALTAEAAVFQTLTHDEIVIDTNFGGRTTYENAGRTRRQGAEASLQSRLAHDWQLQLAYTYVDAQYRDTYRTCAGSPCHAPALVIPAGNLLPGVPHHDLFASARWGGEFGPNVELTAQYLTQVPVNDANSVFAPAYAVFGLGGGYAAEVGQMRVNGFLRLNNLFDRRYVGSVIVDDGNGRFFEPAPGFNVLAGIEIRARD